MSDLPLLGPISALDRLDAWGAGLRGRRLPWCATAFGTGVGAYFALPVEPDARAPLVLALLCLLLGWAAWRGRGGRGAVALVLLFALAGLACAQMRAQVVAGPVLEWRLYGAVEGRVVLVDRGSTGHPRITLDRVRLDRVAPADTPRRVRLSLHDVAPPAIGARVMTTAHLVPPAGPSEPGGFDFQRHAWFLKLGAVGYTRVPVLLAAPEPEAGPVARARAALTAHLRAALPGQGGAVASAIVTGDRAALPPDVVEALRRSNLAHLLAISGLHMGLLAGLVFWVVRGGLAAIPPLALTWPTKPLAAAVALPVAFAYLLISGQGVATQRAFVMTAVVLGAVILGRRALTLRAVAIAALVVLALAPEALVGPGFQMSFAATAALVLAFRATGRLPGPRWLAPVLSLLVASTVAGLATAPFAAAHFNRVTPWGLGANLLAVPAMGTLVMPGLLAGLILAPLGLEALPYWVAERGIAWIVGVAEWFAARPGAIRGVPAPGPWVLPLLGLSACAFAAASGGRRGVGAIGIAAALVLWAEGDRPDVLVASDGRLVGWMGPDGRALDRASGAGFAAARWLEDDGDLADQEAAAARPSPFDHAVRRVPKGEEARCDGTLWVQPLPDRARPPCPVIDAQTLAATGAIALRRDGDGWVWTTARSVQGDRPWSPR